MSWIKALMGTPKIVSTVADTVKSGVSMLDNAFFTDQEKSAASIKFTELWLAIQKATANENSIKSVTRRILAWGIMGTFLFLILSACAIYKFDPAWAIFIKDSIKDTQLGWLVVAVGVFYFGYYAVSNMRKNEK